MGRSSRRGHSQRDGDRKNQRPWGVIDFEPEGRPYFIAPQRARYTRNIAVGINSPLRGGSIESPNNRSISAALAN